MTTKYEEIILAPSLTLRSVKWNDIKAVAQLILDVCTADGDPTVASTEDDIRRFWTMSDVHIETDIWVVETKAGKIIGYQEFYNKHAHAALVGDGYVHPEYHGLGIGTALLRTLENRAHQEMNLADPDVRVYIRNGIAGTDVTASELHENEGYKPIRYSWHMEIELPNQPQVPAFPDGIELRPFILEEHNRAVYEAHEEAFRDHWDHVRGTFEEWNHRMIEREDLDPSLWFIAWDDDQVAGYSLCRYRMESGWVGSLGVRRPWRKRGLGEALLLHSFGEFYKRGTKIVGLGVDAQNPTGATHLYQKTGMHIAAEFVIYEKELRPGKEIGVQALS